jgi:hypothetical protein
MAAATVDVKGRRSSRRPRRLCRRGLCSLMGSGFLSGDRMNSSRANKLIGSALFVYGLILVWTHGLAIFIFYREFFRPESSLSYLGVFLLVIVPIGFGPKIRTWRQFGAYFLITLVAWQISPWVMDWAVARLSDQIWWKDRTGTWTVEILRRCLYPSILACAGALVGRPQNSPRHP